VADSVVDNNPLGLQIEILDSADDSDVAVPYKDDEARRGTETIEIFDGLYDGYGYANLKLGFGLILSGRLIFGILQTITKLHLPLMHLLMVTYKVV